MATHVDGDNALVARCVARRWLPVGVVDTQQAVQHYRRLLGSAAKHDTFISGLLARADAADEPLQGLSPQHSARAAMGDAPLQSVYTNGHTLPHAARDDTRIRQQPLHNLPERTHPAVREPQPAAGRVQLRASARRPVYNSAEPLQRQNGLPRSSAAVKVVQAGTDRLSPQVPVSREHVPLREYPLPAGKTPVSAQAGPGVADSASPRQLPYVRRGEAQRVVHEAGLPVVRANVSVVQKRIEVAEAQPASSERRALVWQKPVRFEAQPAQYSVVGSDAHTQNIGAGAALKARAAQYVPASVRPDAVTGAVASANSQCAPGQGMPAVNMQRLAENVSRLVLRKLALESERRRS